MNLAQCAHLHRRALRGTWVRALHPRHIANPLATAHTRTHASRFNPGTPAGPAFEILYLADDATVALFEVQALRRGSQLRYQDPMAGNWVTLP